MKILFIIPKLGGGGAEILLGTICEELHKREHEIKIVCLHSHHETFQNFPNKTFIEEQIKPVIISSEIKFSFLRKTKVENDEYRKIVDDFNPDVIHSHLYESELIAYSYIKDKVHYFSHAHDNMIQLAKFKLGTLFNKKLITNFYERNWLQKRQKIANAQFITISKDSNAYLIRNLGSAFTKKIHLLPNAIDLTKFYRNESTHSKTYILSAGNLVDKKGHTLLIETAIFLKQKRFNYEINILGYGPLYDVLSRKIKENKLEENVFLRGNVNNVNEYLANSDIYVHTASYEPFGLVLVEAMASGLPVVCTDGKGNRDLIIEGENGFMIWNRDPELIAAKIELLIKNEAQRSKMGQIAKLFSQKFDIVNYTDKLIALYQL